MEGAWQGREAIAPRPRKSGDFLFASSREAKSSPQAEQAVRHEAETRLQQRLKGHLKEFRREAASTEIKARPPKSDEEICRDLSSTEALEMRSFRGSDLWLSYITTSLDGTQILAPRWKEHTVDADVPLASGSLDIFLGAASLDPMDLMQQDGCASRSQSQDRRSDRGEAEMAAISPSAEEKPRASATKVDAFLLEEVPAASKSSKESLFKTEVDVLVPANMQEQVAPALEMEDIFNKHAGGDGALSQQELEMLQGENAHLRQLDFDKLDLDGDGVVSKEELATALDWDTMEEVKGEDLLRRYDGGDGTLSREELEQMKGENAHLRQLDFDKLDLDGDGVVSKEELATALDWDSMGEVKEEVSARGNKLAAGIALGRLISDASSMGGPKLLATMPVRRFAGQVGHVLKHTLKRRVRNRAQEAVLKVSLTAAAASMEVQPTCKLWERLAHFGFPRLRNMVNIQGRAEFSEVCSADAQLHAVLARQVYLDPSERGGLLTSSMQVKGVSTSGDFWYAYVGGDTRRGFWYCPSHGGHLALAERGTQLLDAQDLARDAWITLGSSTALRSRVENSQEQLQDQCFNHSCTRVTATGHSLGGAVAAGLAKQAKQGLDAVHLFNAGGKRASDASNAKAKAAKVASALDVHKKSREAFDLRSAASQRKEKRRAKRKSIQDLAETSDIVQNGDVAQESGHSKDEGLQRKTATEQAISTTIANNLADPEIRRRAATSVEDQEQRIVGDVEHALEVEGHGGVPSEESEVGQETLAQQKQNQEVSQEKVAHPGQEKRQKRVGQEHEARREKREHQEQQEQQKQDITGEHVAEQGPEKQETKEQEPRQEHVTQQASAKQELQEPELCRECVAQQGLEKQEPQEHEPRQEQGPEEQEQGGCEDLGAHGMQSKEEKRVSQEHEASQEKEQLEQEASHEDVAQQEHDKQHQEHITRGREAHAEEVGQKHKAQEMQEKHQGQEQDENAPESVAIRRSAGSAGLVVARQIVKQSGEQPTPEEGLLANLPDQREDEMPKEHVFAGQAEAAAPSVRTSMKSNESLVQGCHPPADQVSEDRRRLQDLREAGVLESASESEGTITPKEDAREPALQQEDQGRDSYVIRFRNLLAVPGQSEATRQLFSGLGKGKAAITQRGDEVTSPTMSWLKP
eukprot:s861_g19.t1